MKDRQAISQEEEKNKLMADNESIHVGNHEIVAISMSI